MAVTRRSSQGVGTWRSCDNGRTKIEFRVVVNDAVPSIYHYTIRPLGSYVDSALVGLDWTIETSSNATKTNAASSSSGSQPQREPLEIVERSLATYRIQRTWMKAPSINNSCEDIKVFFLGDRFNYITRSGVCGQLQRVRRSRRNVYSRGLQLGQFACKRLLGRPQRVKYTVDCA